MFVYASLRIFILLKLVIMNKKLEIRLPVLGDIKKLEVVKSDKKGVKYYIATVNAGALVTQGSDLDLWKDVNPRDVKESSYVWKAMKESLEFDPENFIFKNKGLLLLVDDLDFDNKNKSIDIKLSDKLLHGIVDGGHTFAVFKEALEELSLDDVYVKVEIIEGINDRGVVADLAEARNTAAQVKEESIMNLKDAFNDIKRVLKPELYGDRIAYKEYAKDKDISIKEILGYLVAFDVVAFDVENPPIKAYSSKKMVLKHYEDVDNKQENYRRINRQIVPLLPEILVLWDTIRAEIPGMYQGKILSVHKGDPDKPIVKDYSKRNKKVELPFIEKEMNYKVPEGWVFPIFAAFRHLIQIDDDGLATFKVNPVEFFLANKDELSTRFTRVIRDMPDPQTVGKSSSVWTSFSDKIEYLLLQKK